VLALNGSVRAICKDRGNLYIGYGAAFADNIDYVSYLNPVVNNGSHIAYPVIKIKRTGGTSAIMTWIKNETTGATLFLDYSLLDGEEVVLDFRQGKRGVTSSMFGDVWDAVLRGSDFGNFFLMPGSNSISVFVRDEGDPTVDASIRWQTSHWSMDGGV